MTANKRAGTTTAAQPTYFELTVELDESEQPEPILLRMDDGSTLVIEPPTVETIAAMRVAQSPTDIERAMLGDAYDQALKLAASKPRRWWPKFISQVSDHFYGNGADDAPGGSRA